MHQVFSNACFSREPGRFDDYIFLKGGLTDQKQAKEVVKLTRENHAIGLVGTTAPPPPVGKAHQNIGMSKHHSADLMHHLISTSRD